jgi:hypothetical protein
MNSRTVMALALCLAVASADHVPATPTGNAASTFEATNANNGEWFVDLVFMTIRLFCFHLLFLVGWFPVFFVNYYQWVQEVFGMWYYELLAPKYVKENMP